MSGLEDQYYSVRQVSERLGVTPETVQRWIRSGQLKALAFGGRMGYRVTQAELASFVARRALAAEVEKRLASAE